MGRGTGRAASEAAKVAESAVEKEKSAPEESPEGADAASVEVSCKSCLLIGPPRSGKTSFVTAVARAGLLAATEAACLPLGHAAWLVKDACLSLRSRTPLAFASAQDGSYSFDLRGSGKTPEAGDIKGQLTIHELSGTNYFPADEDDSEVAADPPSFAGTAPEWGKNANYLVLCADILEPRPDDWQVALVGLFDDLATVGSESEIPKSSSSGWLGPRATAFDRVLLVFTRLDLLCQRIWEETVQSGETRALYGRRPRPAKLAARIDPLAQAIHSLGESTLALLLGSLKPGAQLGVGCVSAGGFHPRTDLPFLDEEGRPAAAGHTVGNWYPYGLLECIDFLLGGRTSSIVRPINRAVLQSERRVRWHDLHAEWLRRSSAERNPSGEM